VLLLRVQQLALITLSLYTHTQLLKDLHQHIRQSLGNVNTGVTRTASNGQYFRVQIVQLLLQRLLRNCCISAEAQPAEANFKYWQ
jgi:hypothetical protein